MQKVVSGRSFKGRAEDVLAAIVDRYLKGDGERDVEAARRSFPAMACQNLVSPVLSSLTGRDHALCASLEADRSRWLEGADGVRKAMRRFGPKW